MGCDEKYKTRRATRLVLLKTGSGAWGVFRGSQLMLAQWMPHAGTVGQVPRGSTTTTTTNQLTINTSNNNLTTAKRVCNRLQSLESCLGI